jgi:hypothetical protein
MDADQLTTTAQITHLPGSTVVDLGPHERMTPEQALSSASREAWENVLICGFHVDSGEIIVRSSHMTREFALWIIEHAKLHAMDRL